MRLVEAGFINSDVDNNLFDTKFSETAEAIARGIDETIRDAGYTVAQGDMRSDVAQVSAPVSEEMYIAKSENDASGTDGRRTLVFKTNKIVSAGDITISAEKEIVTFNTQTVQLTNSPMTGTIYYKEDESAAQEYPVPADRL